VKSSTPFTDDVRRFSVNLVSISLLWANVLVRYRSYRFAMPRDTCRLDINECAQKPGPCKLGERCDNTPGSYRCVQTFSCATGLEMKDLQCLGRTVFSMFEVRDELIDVDIDECTIGNRTCLPPATCKNTYGSFYVSELDSTVVRARDRRTISSVSMSDRLHIQIWCLCW
jgi:hypothetical protein